MNKETIKTILKETLKIFGLILASTLISNIISLYMFHLNPILSILITTTISIIPFGLILGYILKYKNENLIMISSLLTFPINYLTWFILEQYVIIFDFTTQSIILSTMTISLTFIWIFITFGTMFGGIIGTYIKQKTL